VTIVIVGARPIGLMSASLLGRLGVDTLFIERNAAPYDVPRAITLDDEGARTLQAAGLDQAYLLNARRGWGSRYYDDDGQAFAEVGPGLIEYGFPRRTQIFQPEFEQVLLDGLDHFSHLQATYRHEFLSVEQDVNGITLTVAKLDASTVTLRARYLLACDGARNPTRQRLGIEMLGDTYPEDWLILDMVNDPDQEPASKFFCRSNRPYVRIPARRGGRRCEFRAAAGETTGALLDPATIRDLLKPIRTVADGDILRRVVYTFEARIAERWAHERVFLLGDAAHLTPPPTISSSP
jgi:3-(3-hydroxy-phenyl)propionate hydroxylase